MKKRIDQREEKVYNFGMMNYSIDSLPRQLADKIEEGEIIQIIKDGKKIADVTPSEKKQGWKRERLRVTLKGAKTSTEYLREMRDEN